MEYSPLYQMPNSRDPENFNSDLLDGAIDTANRYLREMIDNELRHEERIEAMINLADELAHDSGNHYIVRAIRERIVLEKSTLDMQTDSLLV